MTFATKAPPFSVFLPELYTAAGEKSRNSRPKEKQRSHAPLFWKSHIVQQVLDLFPDGAVAGAQDALDSLVLNGDQVKELGDAGVIELGVNTISLVCGPPIMIKFVLAALKEMGASKDKVYTTLELRMKCGIGKCGRCNIGSKYVCKDGPVFRCDEIDELPNEY